MWYLQILVKKGNYTTDYLYNLVTSDGNKSKCFLAKKNLEWQEEFKYQNFYSSYTINF